MRVETRSQQRETVTDNDGHYAFDGVDRGVAYVLSAKLSGFQPQEYRNGTHGDSASIVNIDFSMPVGCISEFQTLAATAEPASALDRMLTASTIVYLRILEETAPRITLDDDGCWREADRALVTVLGTSKFSRPQVKSLISVVVNRTDSAKLTVGSEYLMFVERYSSGFVSSHNMWRVKEGRITEAIDELGVWRGMPIADALERLREVYRQYTRYREFDEAAPHAHIGSLLRSGWLPIGRMASRRNVWTHGEQEFYQPPFEFLSEVKAGRVVPRAGDRIRLTQDDEFIIVDFSKTGEARLRTPPPSVRTKYVLPHQTGVVAHAGDVYRVDDVRFEQVDGGRTVWVRLSLYEKRADP